MEQARGATPGRRLRAVAGLRRDPVLVALGGGTAAMIIWYAMDLAGRPAQVLAAWTFVAAVHVCLTGVARSIARTPGLGPPTRRFWHAVAIAGLIYLAGDLTQVITAAGDPHAAVAATGGPVQLGALSLGSAWLGIALLMSPLGLQSRKERVRFWLDVATVMVAAVVVGWYLIVPDRPAALLDAAGPVLMGPVILLLCVFVVAKLTMSGTAPFTRWTAAIGVVAAAVKSGADAIGSDGLDGGRLHWYLAAMVASHALLALAVRVNQVQVAGDPGLLRVRRRRPYSLLPYGAVAVTYLLLTVAVWRGDAGTVAIALGGAAVSTGLVVVRQLAAFRENAHLLGELDAKVRELHVTQEGLRASLAERDALAAELRHRAFHDDLTGLPNRALYAERVRSELAAGHDVTVMLVDLDDFKLVNDAWGHAAGDDLLREIGIRLQACVRPDDTVARLGGDEFAVLLRPQPGDDPREIAARIVAAAETPVAIDGGYARVGASVGIASAGAGSASRGLAPADGAGSASRALASTASDSRERASTGSDSQGFGAADAGAGGASRGVACADGAGAGSVPQGLASAARIAGGPMDGETLLREADHAMYAVKRAGKGSFALATPDA